MTDQEAITRLALAMMGRLDERLEALEARRDRQVSQLVAGLAERIDHVEASVAADIDRLRGDLADTDRENAALDRALQALKEAAARRGGHDDARAEIRQLLLRVGEAVARRAPEIGGTVVAAAAVAKALGLDLPIIDGG